MGISDTLKIWAKRVKRDGVTLWFAGKHPKTPWYAKALGLFVVAYALSPIDLILTSSGAGLCGRCAAAAGLIWLTLRLLPSDVLTDCRDQADAWMQTQGAKPRSMAGAVLVVALWLALGAALWMWLRPLG